MRILFHPAISAPSSLYVLYSHISAGGFHTLSITNKQGWMWNWGYGLYGQLGINSTIDKCTPMSIGGTKRTFCVISSGGYHSLAIDRNGKTWGWGSNVFGQIGDNSTTSRRTPTSIYGANVFCKVAAGRYHSAAIDNGGLVWCWGLGSDGELGNGSTLATYYPKSINSVVGKTFCKIAVGMFHTMVIDSTGMIWGWGNNQYGELGAGDTTYDYAKRCVPTSIAGGNKTFCEISIGHGYDGSGNNGRSTATIDHNGLIWSWGVNAYGNLGDNTTNNRSLPVSVLGGKKTFCKIAVGDIHMAAIDHDGLAWCWGSNFKGELGDNSTTSRRTPISVGGVRKTFCQISAGYEYTIAIDNHNQVWGWGYNNQGQLGLNNTTASILTPTKIYCAQW